MSKREKIKKWIADKEGEISRFVYYAIGVGTGVGVGYMIATNSWNKNASVIVSTTVDTAMNAAEQLEEADKLIGGLVHAVQNSNKSVLSAVKALPTEGTTWGMTAEALSV